MTHASIDRDDLHNDVAAFVKENLGSVVSVGVSESGDRFVVLTVVIDGSTKAFVRDRPPGLLRQLRAMFLDRGLDAFPSLNLVSSAEAA